MGTQDPGARTMRAHLLWVAVAVVAGCSGRSQTSEPPIPEDLSCDPLPKSATSPVGRWIPGPQLVLPRTNLAAFVTLRDGRVMVIGGRTGRDDASCTARAEIVDAVQNTSTEVLPMSVERCGHTATALSDGTVLVIGGDRGKDDKARGGRTAERWDPETGAWTDAGTLSPRRERHSATLLPDDHVLVVGGAPGSESPAELWDENAFRDVGKPRLERSGHLGLLRSDGRVIVVFGDNAVRETDIWDPSSETWSTGERIPEYYGENLQVAPLGGDKYLVATSGGEHAKEWDIVSNSWRDVTTELRIPTFGRSALIGDGKMLIGAMVYDVLGDKVAAADEPLETTQYRAALSDRRVLDIGYTGRTSIWLADAEPVGSWKALYALPLAAFSTLTPLGDDHLLITGGFSSSVDLSRAVLVNGQMGEWKTTGSLRQARHRHVAIQLADGRVLVAGGTRTDPRRGPTNYSSPPSSKDRPPLELDTIEVWDPGRGRWTAGGRMKVPRQRLTASRLRDGRVLLVGGHAEPNVPVEYTGYWRLERSRWPLNVSELWDPKIGAPSLTKSLHVPRTDHAAVALDDGRVLVVGGVSANEAVTATGEIWDPQTGAWAAIASMLKPRAGHTATLLLDGRVLVVGGYMLDESIPSAQPSAEVWDPTTDAWTLVVPPTIARSGHHARALHNGHVLIGGGTGASCDGTAEAWNPATGQWAKAATLPSCIRDLVSVDGDLVAVISQVRKPGAKAVHCAVHFLFKDGPR